MNDFGNKAIFNFEDDEGSKFDIKTLKEICVEDTENFFRVAMNYWYMKTFVGKESMHDLKGFLKTIKSALTLTINTNKWMQEKTKQAAQLKLNKMLNYIASPSEIKDDNQLDDYYKYTGTISNENYAYAFKKMSKWIKHDELTKLRETSDKEVALPSEVNAFYSHYDNKIQILIGFLSPPNFYAGAPLAVNVPAIGSTIGHEITHGFDNKGSKFDSTGIKHNWWDKRTQKQYESKVKCFVDQYSKYVEPKTGKTVNGNITIGENIADNGAIHQAFTAYKIYAALKHPEKDLKLPGEMSRFTKDQLFFIAYANTFCSDHSIRWINYALTDVHAPDDSRVIVPLQNSQEFAKAFNCKKGSRMNPEEKCVLW
ncbi:Neprilysin-1-like protein [Leptotrombidium deliense]|uniref:Neprilysin-1-like protein n=1 Tax=Leptotrombidium deliense TaxID=299467 RepID=A0A443S944_9ACAR|nr:Neprilysin-1-like protein [Leptotrombidium deliense]